jgi:hypothetical protein
MIFFVRFEPMLTTDFYDLLYFYTIHKSLEQKMCFIRLHYNDEFQSKFRKLQRIHSASECI